MRRRRRNASRVLSTRVPRPSVCLSRFPRQPADTVLVSITHPLLLTQGIHPTTIAEAFQRASAKAVEFLTEMSTPVDLNDRETLLRAASTSLNSKVRFSRSAIVTLSLTPCPLSPLLSDRLPVLFRSSPHRRFVGPSARDADVDER